MDTAISSVLSEARSGYASPPFDELEKTIENFIKAIGELLNSEDPELVSEIVALLRKIIEAKNDFLYQKIMKEAPEGGTPFTRAIGKEKEEKEEVTKQPPALASRAQVKRPTETTFRDKD
jgi:hypothetical protein